MKVILNFFSVVLLVSLIAAPFYFAHNFSKVAGVKSQSEYLIVSQIDKFPNLTLSQNGENYTIDFQKYGESQAFLGVLVINNPTPDRQEYILDVNFGDTKVFFDQNISDQKTEITLTSQSSVPISLLSETGSAGAQTVEFTINTK